ncbi:MAG: hypothetical protein HC913_00995 [Microscillaceae bacterium]|nr:hypothetical protein [Microscillaceae bacterium]
MRAFVGLWYAFGFQSIPDLGGICTKFATICKKYLFITGPLPMYYSEFYQEKLNELFDFLKHTADPEEISQIETQIWELWSEGGHLRLNELMEEGCQALEAEQHDEAILVFSQMIALFLIMPKAGTKEPRRIFSGEITRLLLMTSPKPCVWSRVILGLFRVWPLFF